VNAQVGGQAPGESGLAVADHDDVTAAGVPGQDQVDRGPAAQVAPPGLVFGRAGHDPDMAALRAGPALTACQQ